jgi:hypothetical protein
MKNLLKHIWVSDAPAVPVEVVVKAAVKPQLFSLPIEYQSVAEPNSTGLAIDPGLVEHFVEHFYNQLKEGSLSDMFKFSDAAQKLSLVADAKTRFLSALAVTGLDAKTVLDSIDKFQPALSQLVINASEEPHKTWLPSFTEKSKQLEVLKAQRADLIKQLETLDTSIGAMVVDLNVLEQISVNHNAAITAASDQLVSEFDKLAQQLKANLV